MNIFKNKYMIILFIFFTVLLSATKTHAYWTNSIISLSYQSSHVITIGNWQQTFKWTKAVNYQEGDRVIYNGEIYVAKRQNINIEPDNNKFWRIDRNK